MSKVQDFIVEIGTEELPPNDLTALVTSFAKSIVEQLAKCEIDHGTVIPYVTPRRLAVFIKDLADSQPEQKVEKRGPALRSAYTDDGKPTKAAEGFASSCGVALEQITTLETDKGSWLYYQAVEPGANTIDLLAEIVSIALGQLPIKRNMRWGAGDLSFVRPVHWVLMLYGKNVVNGTIFGLEPDSLTYGHRIHSPTPIKIPTADQYAIKLEKDGMVIPDFAKRKEYIRQQIMDIATAEEATALIDPDLLTTVTGLIEHPVALLATFDADFLRVPKECLISAMQDHQKCFTLIDEDNNLLPKFVVISNLTSTDPAAVVHGNELVMHARLADAAFHYDTDLQNSLAYRIDKLKNIIYQKKLGTIHDKTIRISNIAKHIANVTDSPESVVQRAAELCKADLVTNMVYEFPELQGTMGYYYALHDNEPEEVATAILEHYKPKFAQDNLPSSPAGITLAIADRVDTLVGMFGIGKIPTGEKDPFALRRQALALLRILIDKEIELDLLQLFSFAAAQYGDKIRDPGSELLLFCFDRLKAWYLTEDVPAKVFASVMANKPTSPVDFHRRVVAVLEFQNLPAAVNLAAANKRVHNILEKSQIDTISKSIDPVLLVTPEEQTLYQALEEKNAEISPLMDESNYSAILQSLASLQSPIDSFFDHVMVNAEEQNLRNNRLQILQSIRKLFLQVADVSLL